MLQPVTATQQHGQGRWPSELAKERNLSFYAKSCEFQMLAINSK
jgi:hypothetical protein